MSVNFSHSRTAGPGSSNFCALDDGDRGRDERRGRLDWLPDLPPAVSVARPAATTGAAPRLRPPGRAAWPRRTPSVAAPSGPSVLVFPAGHVFPGGLRVPPSHGTRPTGGTLAPLRRRRRRPTRGTISNVSYEYISLWTQRGPSEGLFPRPPGGRSSCIHGASRDRAVVGFAAPAKLIKSSPDCSHIGSPRAGPPIEHPRFLPPTVGLSTNTANRPKPRTRAPYIRARTRPPSSPPSIHAVLAAHLPPTATFSSR